MQTFGAARLTRHDLATGTPLGLEALMDLPRVPRGFSPLDALIEAMTPALRRGRCLVAFSGGRDSSIVLAVATEAARRQGLDDPIPVTLLYPGALDERRQRMVRFLGLNDWERIDVADELQFLGPVAREAIRRHGVLYPGSAHTMLPALERARGGTLFLAHGQAEIFSFWRWQRLANVMARRSRPGLGDLRHAALALAGSRARRLAAERIVRSQAPEILSPPWIASAAAADVSRRLARTILAGSVRFGPSLRELAGHRCLLATSRTMRALADSVGARVEFPSLEPRVVAATVQAGGAWGWAGHAEFAGQYVGHLLPEDTLTGQPPASGLERLFFGQALRDFAESWSGHGVDESLVDPEALRRVWRTARPDWRTGLLLQQAWLHDDAARGRAEGLASAA